MFPRRYCQSVRRIGVAPIQCYRSIRSQPNDTAIEHLYGNVQKAITNQRRTWRQIHHGATVDRRHNRCVVASLCERGSR